MTASIHRLEDGRLLIVGHDAYKSDAQWEAATFIGPDEYPIVISSELLSSYVQEEVKKATEKLREALKPFAAEYDSWLESADDNMRYSSFIDANDHYPGGSFTIGDLHRAFSALSGKPDNAS